MPGLMEGDYVTIYSPTRPRSGSENRQSGFVKVNASFIEGRFTEMSAKEVVELGLQPNTRWRHFTCELDAITTVESGWVVKDEYDDSLWRTEPEPVPVRGPRPHWELTLSRDESLFAGDFT